MKFLAIAFFILLNFFVQAQEANQFADSLQGFDQQDCLKVGREHGLSGFELRNYLKQKQRQFIDDRFELPSVPNSTELRPLPSFPCTNDDFENSPSGSITTTNQIDGWTFSDGNSTGTDHCFLTQCCALSPTSSALISAANGYTDNLAAAAFYTIYSVFGTGSANSAASAINPQITIPIRGDNFVRMGNSTIDYSTSRATKVFTVTPTNSFFKYAYIFINQPGHGCCFGATFQMSVSSISTNSTITGGFKKSMGPNACSSFDNYEMSIYRISNTNAIYSAVSSASVIYNPWTIRYLDLSAYMGEVVRIDFTVGDCTTGGHFGYCYLDAECSSSPKILINGGTSDTVCTKQFTLSTDLALNGVKWMGPNNIGGNGNSLVTSSVGMYTLVMPAGSNSLTTQSTINVVYKAKQAQVNHAYYVLCEGQSVGMQVYGMQTATWSTGATGPTISAAPLEPVTLTVTGTDIDGCDAIATIVIELTNCTSINENKSDFKIGVYPNPAPNQLTVNLPQKTGKCVFELKDLEGKIILRLDLDAGKNTINTKELKSGTYLYQIRNSDSVLETGKIRI